MGDQPDFSPDQHGVSLGTRAVMSGTHIKERVGRQMVGYLGRTSPKRLGDTRACFLRFA